MARWFLLIAVGYGGRVVHAPREQITENREQRTESREQRTESREQRTESREQRTENREQIAGNREQIAEGLGEGKWSSCLMPVPFCLKVTRGKMEAGGAVFFACRFSYPVCRLFLILYFLRFIQRELRDRMRMRRESVMRMMFRTRCGVFRPENIFLRIGSREWPLCRLAKLQPSA